MKILINYASHKFEFRRNLNSITGSLAGDFDKVIEYAPEDLDSAFRQRNKHILENPQGAGYWLWKPYIIKKTLENMRLDDFLFYSDAGSIFIGSAVPLIKTMQRTDQDVIAFENHDFKEREWTKRDAFILMGCDTLRYTDTLQLMCGFSLWRKTAFSMKLVSEWLHYAQDERVITDIPNQCGKENYPGFRANRHDQSIWSLLCKKHQVTVHRRPYAPYHHQKALFREYPHSTYPRFVFIYRFDVRSLLKFCLTHSPMKSRMRLLILVKMMKYIALRLYIKYWKCSRSSDKSAS